MREGLLGRHGRRSEPPGLRSVQGPGECFAEGSPRQSDLARGASARRQLERELEASVLRDQREQMVEHRDAGLDAGPPVVGEGCANP